MCNFFQELQLDVGASVWYYYTTSVRAKLLSAQCFWTFYIFTGL
jgi:hypothetical protein